jgi:hypothetical protein
MPSKDYSQSGALAPRPGIWCDRPDLALPSIALPIIGMLGGACGEPVSVWLEDYPPDILGALLRFIRDHVPDERVCEVFGPADLRRLLREAHAFAVVFVYPIPGHTSATLVARWLLERSRRTRLPMVLLCGERCDQETPGSMISLRAGRADIARLQAFLAGHPLPDGRVKAFLSGPWGDRLAVSLAGLPALFGPSAGSHWIPRSLRAVQTLRGLLAGHCLLGRLGVSPGDHGLISPDLDDYAGVYELLQRSRAGLPEDSGDPLLAAMIRRANLYLKIRDDVPASPQHVQVGREGLTSLTTKRTEDPGSRGSRPIGLRELADLGNVRSSMTLSLVDAALNSGDAGAIRGLGLLRRLPADPSPRSPGREAIVPLLVTWSMKQVRKRFDRLQRQGFIEAERIPPGNGPWVIHLPEELRPLPGEFQGLPSVHRVVEACRPTG